MTAQHSDLAFLGSKHFSGFKSQAELSGDGGEVEANEWWVYELFERIGEDSVQVDHEAVRIRITAGHQLVICIGIITTDHLVQYYDRLKMPQLVIFLQDFAPGNLGLRSI